MKWLDALFGREKPLKSQLEKLFTITTAYVTLQTKLDLTSTGKAGLCFRPVTSSYFEDAESEVMDLLKLSGKEMGTKVESVKDSYGFQWLVLDDKEFEDLVATMHMVSQTLEERGFGEQMLAAIFEFKDKDGQLVYWIYNYKRGNFYPFVPMPRPKGTRQRDNAYELRLRAVMESEMPIETELERWYPMWDVPLSQV